MDLNGEEEIYSGAFYPCELMEGVGCTPGRFLTISQALSRRFHLGEPYWHPSGTNMVYVGLPARAREIATAYFTGFQSLLLVAFADAVFDITAGLGALRAGVSSPLTGGLHLVCPIRHHPWRSRSRLPYEFQVTVQPLLVSACCGREGLIRISLFRSSRRSVVASRKLDVSRDVTSVLAECRVREDLKRVFPATTTRSGSTGVTGALTSLASTLRGIEVFRIVYWNFLDGYRFVLAKYTSDALQTGRSGSSFSSTRKPTRWARPTTRLYKRSLWPWLEPVRRTMVARRRSLPPRISRSSRRACGGVRVWPSALDLLFAACATAAVAALQGCGFLGEAPGRKAGTRRASSEA